ncbi:glycoside hydrolase family 127 protein [Lachnoclostridium sp. Marseille-P6806]|uniref:glycoside hydrolase family 127 protein n=1 Tax=Lachnoclostridium sp. Marseille-P6806 TaxID=2364793 RepID=UPI001031A924|nr:beta-L-arabinofuranosidase domain-containing protein [Lachnoclostridium sp. Marseille-P6806]
MLTDTRKSPYAKASPPDSRAVVWTDGFWRDVEQTVFSATVPQLRRMFDCADISHVVENFRIAAGEREGVFDGTVFGDGDFYKWMEAAMYSAVRTGDSRLLAELDEYIALIGRAQQPDGYLSTKQIIGEKSGTGASRMGDINDFEVYNFGHLFTAAALHYRLTGKVNFLSVAERTADYLEGLYEEARRKGEIQTAVCPSHYMGLIELYRVTGKDRYLRLAKEAVTLRDSVRHGLDDNQDRLPLRRHRRIIGHAVRANYLYAGVADLYMETGDPQYREVLDSVWEDLLRSKIYITGGCGALYNGASPYGNFFDHQLVHQAYGYAYQLPNITAYNETCANVGLVMWAYRMFLAEPKAQYFDIIERVMLNTNLAAVSLDGLRFFYENMLERTARLDYELVWKRHRTDYILSYCCPPNLARNLAEASEYCYAQSGDIVYTGLYGSCRAQLVLAGGAAFTLTQRTEYPSDGRIVFEVSEVKARGAAKLALRIPVWARGASVAAGGKRVLLSGEDEGSYYEVPLALSEGEKIELMLPMEIRLTAADDMVEEDRGRAAVERGPLVYCMETADLPEDEAGRGMSGLWLAFGDRESFLPEELEIAGRRIPALRGRMRRRSAEERTAGSALYRRLEPAQFTEVPVTMIPYYAWDNRSAAREAADDGTEDEMRIWFPVLWS